MILIWKTTQMPAYIFVWISIIKIPLSNPRGTKTCSNAQKNIRQYQKFLNFKISAIRNCVTIGVLKKMDNVHAISISELCTHFYNQVEIQYSEAFLSEAIRQPKNFDIRAGYSAFMNLYQSQKDRKY